MRFITVCLSFLMAFGSVNAGVVLNNETLRYDAEYHLGIVRITAGRAEINVNLDGDMFSGTFNGQSIPWHDRIYAISDTLRASMTKTAGLSLEKVVYENGWYTKPKVKQLTSGKYDSRKPKNYKTIYGQGELDASNGTMEAVTITADMLSLFYYFKEIDFAAMKRGQTIRIPVTLPDGDIQHVVITYKGADNFNDHKTYKVVFEYSYHGQMANYPVTCQIDQDSRIPLLFSANIKIGHIELVLNP